MEDEWKTYRTRFLVRAKQLHGALCFVDALGREHKGEKGDYLIESSEGLLRIASRSIFEDIYVLLELDHEVPFARPEPGISARPLPPDQEGFRPLGAS
jgi:hypothetical protein